METMEMIHKEHRNIEAVLRALKKEIVSLAIDQRVDKVMWAMSLAFIKDSVIDFHHLREREYFREYKLISLYESSSEMLHTITEYHELVELQYNKLVECWNLYQEGQTLARFNVMEEGEKLIRLLGVSMLLEEKLFNLTTHECIVK